MDGLIIITFAKILTKTCITEDFLGDVFFLK